MAHPNRLRHGLTVQCVMMRPRTPRRARLLTAALIATLAVAAGGTAYAAWGGPGSGTYVDGAQAGSATGSTVSLSDGLALRFASQLGANYLSGSMDEIAVYNTVLSAATVTSHFGQ